MWDIIRQLVAQGTTLLLTTQYLDEADALADQIVVIDHGQVIAAGNSEELKNRIGGNVLELSLADRANAPAVMDAVRTLGVSAPELEAGEGKVSVHVGGQGSSAIVEAVRALDHAGIEAADIGLRRPSLDDVFLVLTGHAAESDGVVPNTESTNAPSMGESPGGARPRPPTPADVAVPTLMQRARFAVRDALTVAQRDLLVWLRVPAYIFFTIIQPVMFVLLFRFVFGGAIPVSEPGGYVNYLMPGIIAQTAAFASFGTAIGLARELHKGVIDRFRSMPMARSAVLAGRLTADALRMIVTVLIMVAVGYAVGFRFSNGFGPAVLMIVYSVIFGLVICTVSAYTGLAIKDEESVQSFGLVWLFPLTFVSSAFVPIATMPGWLQGFAQNQPVTKVIDTLRTLAIGHHALFGEAWVSAVWLAGILAVFAPLAVRTYRRA
jgi:ABC transporter DrrB family efflux protein